MRGALPSVFVFVALALLALGCGPTWQEQLRGAASVEHQCARRSIRIVSEDRNELARTVRLDVCGHPRVYRDEGGGRVHVWTDVTSGSEDARVVREPSQTGDDWSLRARGTIADFTLVWLAIPARDAQHVGLTLLAPVTPERRDCDARAMVDGTVTELPQTGHRVVEDQDRIMLELPVEVARGIASARSAVIRLCDEEIRFDVENTAIVRELMARFDEEGGWR